MLCRSRQHSDVFCRHTSEYLNGKVIRWNESMKRGLLTISTATGKFILKLEILPNIDARLAKLTRLV